MKKKITITIDNDLLERFKEYCQHHGMKVSTRLEVLVRQDVSNAPQQQKKTGKGSNDET